MRTFFIWLTGILRPRSSGAALAITSNHMALADFGAFYSAHLLLHAFVFGFAEKRVKSAPNSQADMMCRAMILAAKNLGANPP